MAYCCDLPNGIRLYLDNQGNQTIVTLLQQQAGQQQQSSQGFTTGIWQSPPQLFVDAGGAIIRLNTAIGEVNLAVQGMAVQVAVSAGAAAVPIGLTQVDAMPPGMPPMAPMGSTMNPMAPMQMAPMQMSPMQLSPGNPMSMQMGNMAMSIGATPLPPTVPPGPPTPPLNPPPGTAAPNSAPNSAPSSTPKFCSQCGAAVKPIDRFCASCGHALGA
jgi:hypothetical protein